MGHAAWQGRRFATVSKQIHSRKDDFCNCKVDILERPIKVLVAFGRNGHLSGASVTSAWRNEGLCIFSRS